MRRRAVPAAAGAVIGALLGACDRPPANAPRTDAVRTDAAAGPHLVRFPGPHPTPDTSDYGSFTVERSCVVFTTATSERLQPIFPHDTAAVRASGDALAQVGGVTVTPGRSYRVDGARSEYKHDQPGPAGSNCPRDTFMIGGVSER